MTYFTSPKVELKRNRTDILKIKKIRLIAPPKLNNSHGLCHSVASFITLEIRDSFEFWAGKKLISDSAVAFFATKANGDLDYLEMVYKRNNVSEEFGKDFETTKSFFRKLAVKSLSEFQIKSDPILVDFLIVIFGIRFIDIVSGFLSWSIEKQKNHAVINKMKGKSLEIERLFTERYASVSNAKTFDFGKYDTLFHSFKSIDYKGFNELAENL